MTIYLSSLWSERVQQNNTSFIPFNQFSKISFIAFFTLLLFFIALFFLDSFFPLETHDLYSKMNFQHITIPLNLQFGNFSCHPLSYSIIRSYSTENL